MSTEIFGPRSLEEIMEINKALAVNPGNPDTSMLRDGETLGMQSMDDVRVSIASEEADFSFIREIPTITVDQVLVEYNEYRSHGGGPYNKPFVGQSDRPRYDDPKLRRLFTTMCYMADGFSYNRPSKVIRAIEDPEVIASTASMLRMYEAHSHGFWHNNKELNPLEDDGLFAQVDEVYDCRGSIWSTAAIVEDATRIRRESYGLVNWAVMPFGTKNILDNKFAQSGSQYVLQNLPDGKGGVMQSNIVRGVNCSHAKDGVIEYRTDRWIDTTHFDVPMDEDGVETSIGENPPGVPTVAATENVPNVPGSLWDSDWEGAQEYRVVAVGRHGASMASPAAAVNVSSSGSVTLTITPAATGQATEHFIILRLNRQKGRFFWVDKVRRVPGPGATTYNDVNQYLPGYGMMCLGDFNSQGGQMSPKRTLRYAELLAPVKTLLPLGAGDNERIYRGYCEWYRALQCQAPSKFTTYINVPVDA